MSNLGDTDTRSLQIAAGDGETPLRWCDLRFAKRVNRSAASGFGG
jgi:hypothetical protein